MSTKLVILLCTAMVCVTALAGVLLLRDDDDSSSPGPRRSCPELSSNPYC